jgi:acetyl esterase/lipase
MGISDYWREPIITLPIKWRVAKMSQAEAEYSGALDGILVPEHFVPTPDGISPEAQAFLRMTLSIGAHPMPKSLDDIEGWRAYREAGEAGMIALTKHHETRHPANVTTHSLSALRVFEITPRDTDPRNEGRAIIYVHGGGFSVGGGEAALYPAMQLAGLARCKAYSVDYRMLPEHPFPVPLDDTLEAYRFVLARHRPEQIAIFGASAGANLAPAVVLKARDLGVAMPAAIAMHSCPSDISTWGDSGYTNDTVDTVLRHYMPEINLTYANGHDPRDPYLSPVFGDFSKGFPPCILTTGTRDMLLSGTVRLHRALVRAGIKAELHVWEAMTHAPFFNAPEENELYLQHIDFMLKAMERQWRSDS